MPDPARTHGALQGGDPTPDVPVDIDPDFIRDYSSDVLAAEPETVGGQVVPPLHRRAGLGADGDDRHHQLGRLAQPSLRASYDRSGRGVLSWQEAGDIPTDDGTYSVNYNFMALGPALP